MLDLTRLRKWIVQRRITRLTSRTRKDLTLFTLTASRNTLTRIWSYSPITNAGNHVWCRPRRISIWRLKRLSVTNDAEMEISAFFVNGKDFLTRILRTGPLR